MTVEEWLNNEELPIDIWYKKYRFGEETFDEWLDRISSGNKEVRQLILDKKFIFGGRILANRNLNDRKITYSNCYVITPPEDNLESIFETGAKLARTFSYGGGCGVDISNLRPKGAFVNNAAKTTTGAVSFMDFYSHITGLIGQEGRRGALLLSIDCNHPDLEDFINLKSDLEVCTKANISVRVSDDFMKAVESDSDYILHWPCTSDAWKSIDLNINYDELIPIETNEGIGYVKKVKARRLFNLLAQRNWEMAEPGIIYWDRISNYNLLQNTEFKYAGLNPCCEEPLPAGGSCLLGSINLSQFVVKPFTNDSYIDFDTLEHTVVDSVRALNEVLLDGLKLHPLKEQRDTVYDWRQIGLGTLGMSNMLIKLGLTYGTEAANQKINTVYKFIAKIAVETSLQLAKVEGCFPRCTDEIKEAIVNSDFIKNLNLSQDVISDIRKYGLFNSQLLTCAPTGSISTLWQESGGVEPNYAFSFNRRTVSLNKEETTYKIDAKIVQDYKKLYPNTELPEYFIASQNIPYSDRIKVQSILQRYIDASISSTANLPNETTIEQVVDLYIQAWKEGLKGITIWRDGCQRQAILSTEKPKEEPKQFDSPGVLTENVIFDNTPSYNHIVPVSRKTIGITYGSTFCKKCACGTLYITVNRDSDGNIVEVFTHTSKGGICQANTNAITRMASMALRSGVKVDEVVDQLKGIKCPACITLKAKGENLDGISCPDILSKTIEEFSVLDHCISLEKEDNRNLAKEYSIQVETDHSKLKCPECGEPLTAQGGCFSCLSCGYSRCE